LSVEETMQALSTGLDPHQTGRPRDVDVAIRSVDVARSVAILEHDA